MLYRWSMKPNCSAHWTRKSGAAIDYLFSLSCSSSEIINFLLCTPILIPITNPIRTEIAIIKSVCIISLIKIYATLLNMIDIRKNMTTIVIARRLSSSDKSDLHLGHLMETSLKNLSTSQSLKLQPHFGHLKLIKLLPWNGCY